MSRKMRNGGIRFITLMVFGLRGDVERVSTKSHIRKIKKIYFEYKQSKNSISVRLFGRIPKTNPCGFSTRSTTDNIILMRN